MCVGVARVQGTFNPITPLRLPVLSIIQQPRSVTVYEKCLLRSCICMCGKMFVLESSLARFSPYLTVYELTHIAHISRLSSGDIIPVPSVTLIPVFLICLSGTYFVPLKLHKFIVTWFQCHITVVLSAVFKC